MAEQALALTSAVVLSNPPVPGAISIDVRGPEGPISISGSGLGWVAQTVDGASTITLKTSESNYPIWYALELVVTTQGFRFVSPPQPLGEISLVDSTGTVQQSGFLLVAPMLNMYHDTLTGASIKYNLALQLTNPSGVSFWVSDPTIIFDPPNG